MNMHDTTGTTPELNIRELTATELDHVSGGSWLAEFAGELLSAMEQARRIITGPLP
jgi:hypothetical protein